MLKLYWDDVSQPDSFQLLSPIQPILSGDLPLQDPQGWDSYWTRGQEKSRRVYSVIASVYRRLAIRRSLNHFMHKHFLPVPGFFMPAVVPVRWTRHCPAK